MGGKDAGSKAADAQTEGIEKGIEEQRRQYDLTRKDLLPARGYGAMALRQMASGELGLPDLGPYTFDADGNVSLSNLSAGTATAPPAAPAQQRSIGSSNATPGTPATDIEGMPFSWTQIAEARNRERDAAGWQGVPADTMEDRNREYAAIQDAIAKSGVAQQQQQAATAAAASSGTPQFGQAAQGQITSGFEATPGYQFRLDQGIEAIERSAAASGRRNSGSTLKALAEFGQGIGSQEYGNYYNRLAALSGTGQTATTNLAQIGQNTANNISQGYSDAGAARASGYIADANAKNQFMSNIAQIGMMALI